MSVGNKLTHILFYPNRANQVRKRGMFCVISLSTTGQWLTTYNFNPVFFELCRGAMASSISWARSVDSILC